MLVRDDGDSWTAIGQPAHAWLAGQLARAWNPELTPALVLAIEQHDLAWAQLDRRPPLNGEARRAASFYEVPLEQRLELWSGVASRVLALDPYVAVLVSLHASNIHTRYGKARPEAFLAEQRADQDAILARLPHVSREQAERDADVLFRIDALSLRICGEPGDEVLLDQWPFAVEELRVGLHVRELRERVDDEAALHALLDATDFRWREWLLRPQAPASPND